MCPVSSGFRPRRPDLRLVVAKIAFLYAACFVIVATSSDVHFVSDVGRAFDRLVDVPKPFWLAPGVRIVKRETEPAKILGRRTTILNSAERVFEDHDLVLDAAPGLQMRVTAEDDGRGFRLLAQPNSRPEPRTFGVMRRLKLILLPIMYKLGVITTLLTLLTVFALKGLTIGVLLLIMGSVGFVSKFKSYHHEGYGGGPHKDIHVHVHGGGGGVSHSYSPPYYHQDSWERTGSPASSGAEPQQYVRTRPLSSPQYNNHHFNSQTTPSPWDQFIS